MSTLPLSASLASLLATSAALSLAFFGVRIGGGFVVDDGLFGQGGLQLRLDRGDSTPSAGR